MTRIHTCYHAGFPAPSQVLLAGWMHIDPLEPFDFVEIFSGRQAVTRVMYGTQSTCQSGASPFHR